MSIPAGAYVDVERLLRDGGKSLDEGGSDPGRTHVIVYDHQSHHSDGRPMVVWAGTRDDFGYITQRCDDGSLPIDFVNTTKVFYTEEGYLERMGQLGLFVSEEG
jgi:hypothetical protein